MDIMSKLKEMQSSVSKLSEKATELSEKGKSYALFTAATALATAGSAVVAVSGMAAGMAGGTGTLVAVGAGVVGYGASVALGMKASKYKNEAHWADEHALEGIREINKFKSDHGLNARKPGVTLSRQNTLEGMNKEMSKMSENTSLYKNDVSKNLNPASVKASAVTSNDVGVSKMVGKFRDNNEKPAFEASPKLSR